MNFELPPTGTEQSPAFVTAAACEEWLTTVPMANAVQAQAKFLHQLNLLHRYTLPPTERFAILETLRHPICTVQEEAGKKFAGKVGSSRVDLQACKLEYSIVSPK